MRKLVIALLCSLGAFAANAQSITVTAPNGGEVLYACQTYTITWTATGTSGFYDIDYSLNNGSTWASIASNISVANGQYSWTVPNAESSTCLVRVRDKNDNTKTDVSNAVFTIHIPVVVTAPNGGESWVGNSTHLITWNIQGTSLSFNLDYSTNGGSTWTSIVTGLNVSTGSYNWTVPNIPSATCLVRVRDAVTNCMQDQSDNNFTITPATPILTYPNGGETFNWSFPATVTWNAATFYSNVRLEYSLDNGATWSIITSSTSNTGSYSWTIPSGVNSPQCLVKAGNVSNIAINDVSNATFSILQPKIVITAPNGGESWLGCDLRNVTATASSLPSGFSSAGSTFSFYYSIDNGGTWTFLTNIAGSGASYNYSWTLPNGVSTTQALVRVSNDLYTTLSDTSNAPFSIQPNNVITVTSPNGGESFVGLSSTVISWTNTAGASGLYNIQYSATSPTSGFVTLASGISGNNYNWTNIPNTPGTTYYVRVQDAGNTCKNDVSNAPFTVTAAQPILTYPNGGESFIWGQTVSITWNNSTFYSNVRLDYSLDNGITWLLIANNVSNGGIYNWTVPSGVNSTQCLVKASNVSNVASNDVSNATFSIIQPKIVITSPNGGESWLGCDSRPVTATVTNAPSGFSSSTFTFYYSIDNGSTWTFLTSIAASGSGYSYNWTVPNTINTTQALVRVSNDLFPTLFDTSNAPFSIQPNNVITVTAPNGGEVFPAQGSTVITWTNTAGASGLYNVQFSTTGPTSGFVTLASGISGNSYTWNNITNVPSTNCYIRVQDAGNTCKSDVSNAAFTVTPLSPLLTYPNGGEVFTWNQSVNILWNLNTFYASVRLEYSPDNGVTWQLITSSTTNNGTYSWSVPAGVNSTQCLIKASTVGNVSISDVSNATFSILQPKMTITSPNGGESWLGCDPHAVTATATNLPAGLSSSNFSFYYSIDNGSTWTLLTTLAGSGANYSYSWTLPNGISSTQALVRVSNDLFSTMSDTSNAPFSIQPNNVITVTAPNGAEVFPAQGSTVITWTNTAGASGLYNVQFSATSPTSGFLTLASGISGNSYNWTNITNVPTSTYYVRVQDAGNTCKSDASNAPFTVTPLTPLLTYPNGGESFVWGQTFNITWNANTFYTSIRLEYSTDNGVTWQLITTSASNTGTYSWTIPTGLNSTQCLVKASSVGNVSINDVSNATFSILAPKIVITSPNGGESWLGCDTRPVTFTASNQASGFSSSTFSLFYSIDNGGTWAALTTLPASGSNYNYNWTLPNGVSTTQALVRVSNDLFPTMYDTSNAVFSIQPNSVITVTAPNGGESFVGLSNTVITWTNTAGASGLYNVQYSATSPTSGFVTLASGISGNSYAWNNIPNNPTTTYYVRVQDAGNTCKFDVSNASFTVTPAQPILTYPNGGEALTWAQAINITWNQSTFYSTVRLEYSIDNGTTWQVISTGATNNGTYAWSVPSNVNSTQCLIKASNSANVSVFDVSNATFSIAPVTPVLTYPNGGETFGWGTSPNITWNASTFFSTVRLEYSIDNGTTWVLITAGTANTGSFSWTVPSNVNSTQCLIKASNSANVSVNDVSNATFNIIQPKIVITAPNGGENWNGCESRDITATASFLPAGLSSTNFTFYYSLDNGSTWMFMTSLTGAGTSYTYNWPVPNVSTSQALVRVVNGTFPTMSDTSNAVFTINPTNAITVTSPNGGEVYPGLGSTTITWTNTALAGGLYDVLYSTNGSTYTSLANGITGNSFVWNPIPNTPATTYTIRVRDANNTCKNDVSNANFTVSPLTPLLTYPNGGEQLWAGSSYNILWNANTFYTTVRLEYSIDNGFTWNVITAGTANTGSFSWPVPAFNIGYTNCLVKASSTANVSLNDISNAVFTIKPVVKIFTPNGFDQLGACTQTSINFDHSPAYTSFTIEYSLNHGSTWNTLQSAGTYSGTTGSYTWSVPNTPTTKALVRVYPAGIPSIADASDTDFVIKPSVTVLLPSYGGVLQVGTTYQIKWASDGISNLYDIAYSTSGLAGTYTNIALAYNTATNTYNWTVPNTPSENCFIRVKDNVSACKLDYSDYAFAIRTTPAPIAITAPNTSESLLGCQNYNITWIESGAPVGSYNIDLSADNGSTWSSIVSNYATTGGSYSWIVPNINTVTGLVRVTSSQVSTVTDIDDFPLTIIARTVTAKPDTVICSGATVNLLATGGLGTYNWSPSTYLSSTTIANPVAAPTSSINYIVTSSNGTCVIRDTASIIVQQVPSFSITADATNTCGGQLVTFTANVTGGGANPQFQWKLNGNNVGNNENAFKINTLNNNDSVQCVLTYNPSCFGPLLSNKIGVIVNAKPNLGADVVYNLTCAGCTVNLNTLFNTTGYLYTTWNTTSVSAAGPGIYRLVVSQLNGCTCPDSDTAFAYVNAYAGLVAQVCTGSSTTLSSDASGSSYQWQVNTGSGFVNITNDSRYSGVTTSQLSITNVPSSYAGYQYRCVVNGSTYSSISKMKIIAYWNGSSNTDWENTGNWDCGVVPDLNTDVMINGGKPNYPDIACNRAVHSITTATGTSLKLQPNKILMLTGH